MRAIVVKSILWIALFGLLYANIGFWSLVKDVREDNKIDREIRREEKKQLEKNN